MNKIYFLQAMCNLNEEKHYENVYSTKDEALKRGKEWLDNSLREQYNDWFEDDNKVGIPELTHEQLFELKAIYDFTITEYDPEYVDSLNDINKLQELKKWNISDAFPSNFKPAKIKYSYNHNGELNFITGVFIFKFKKKKKEYEVTMDYKDYINPKAGTMFKVGDIVRVNSKRSFLDYKFENKLHVITNIPCRKKGQKFFSNVYDVITNHNSYDEGCHIDAFSENELELYSGVLPYDSPLNFLSKYYKGEITLNNIKWSDIECGKITLNDNKSFRNITEIMQQLEKLSTNNNT